MSNYIPRGGHFKKTDFLEKCEQDLLREIRSPLSDYTTKRLFRAAERVRSAHLAVLRAKKHYLYPYDETFAARLEKIDMEILAWTAKTADEIIEKYESMA